MDKTNLIPIDILLKDMLVIKIGSIHVISRNI